MLHIISLCAFLILSVPSDSIHAKDANADLQRFATGEGSHRVITSELTVKCTEPCCEATKCQISIIEHLGTGLYVDVFELQQTKNFNYGILTNSDIDIEKPEHESPEHEIYLFNSLNCDNGVLKHSITIPIHLRYHKPTSGGKETYIHLRNPNILINCSKNNDNDVIEFQYPVVESPCDSRNSSMCKWYKVNYECDKYAIVFIVPTGNTNHVWFVFTFTLFITVAGCVYLTYRIMTHGQQRKMKIG